jgi:hypothetical chaperone protein
MNREASPAPVVPDYCAIDFGTSNSAVALPVAAEGNQPAGTRLVALEAGQPTMPTAAFYFAEHDPLPPGAEPPRAYGRAAIAAYVDGHDGRLMRSMKSVLGSSLIEQTTDVGGGHAVKYLDVIASYLRHLKARAEAELGAPLQRTVLGRPVFFVDDDPGRDAQAQAALADAARAAGFVELAFQYEPIAAALDYERQVAHEELVLVADIGGGTSDFSLVRVGPGRRDRLDRKDDILASHGVHVAGTDFDRRISLAAMLRELGYKALGPTRGGQPAREVPSGVYFDLATWHLINTVYEARRVAELKAMAGFYADAAHHRRLMRAVQHRLGHELAARAEAAKIDVAGGAGTCIDLGLVEPGLHAELSPSQATEALQDDVGRIVQAARETARLAGASPESVDALYFTGGSTGLRSLTSGLAAAFGSARAVHGDRFSSVAAGLGLHAQRMFEPA